MSIKYLTMDCPRCDKQMKISIWCLNTPNNEFDVSKLSQAEFNCENCGLTVYFGDSDYETDPEEGSEEYEEWEENDN